MTLRRTTPDLDMTSFISSVSDFLTVLEDELLIEKRKKEMKLKNSQQNPNKIAEAKLDVEVLNKDIERIADFKKRVTWSRTERAVKDLVMRSKETRARNANGSEDASGSEGDKSSWFFCCLL